jgi:subtilisin family serine protease
MDGNTAVTTVAADLAARNGILVCTSAGNEGSSEWVHVLAPADADSTIATGAVWNDTVLASFSSRGPTYDGRIKPDLVAQGVYTYSADPDDDQGYTYCHGTSCSNPLLAGAAALVLAANPFLTPFEVIANLKATATQATWPDTAMGWGLIRTADAVARVTAVIEGQELERWGGKPAPLPRPLTIQASPNPSNPTVQLRIEVTAASPLLVRIYDARGALVDTVFNESVEPGTHDVVWDGKTGDGRDAPSGVYFARAEALRTSVARKVSLVR